VGEIHNAKEKVSDSGRADQKVRVEEKGVGVAERTEKSRNRRGASTAKKKRIQARLGARIHGTCRMSKKTDVH